MGKYFKIHYWDYNLADILGYPNGTKFQSVWMSEFIELVLKNGYQIMLSDSAEDNVTLAQIDSRRFKQR